jgi:hypothetical protein
MQTVLLRDVKQIPYVKIDGGSGNNALLAMRASAVIAAAFVKIVVFMIQVFLSGSFAVDPRTPPVRAPFPSCTSQEARDAHHVERENFNRALFALAFFFRLQDRELLGAISRGLLDCPCRL